MAFVTHERVLAVELVRGEIQTGIGHRVVDDRAPFARHMRVLPAPDHQHLGLDFLDAVQRIVFHPFAQPALVDVRRVETNARQHVRIHCRAK